MSVKLSKYKTKKKHNRDKKTKKKQHIHILNGGMKTLKPKKAPVQHSRTHFSPGDEQETNPQAQQSPSQKKKKKRTYLGHVLKAIGKFIPPKLPNSKYVKKKSNKQNSIKAKTDKKADKVNNNTTPLSNEDAQALLKKTLGGQNNDKNEGYEEGPEKPGKRNKSANNGNGYDYDHKKPKPPPQTLTTEEKGTQSVLKEKTRNEGYDEGSEKPGKRNNKTANNGNSYEHKKPNPPPQTLTTEEKGTQSVLKEKTITGLPINKGVSIGTQSELQGKNPNITLNLKRKKNASNSTHTKPPVEPIINSNIIISGPHAAPKKNSNYKSQNSKPLLSPHSDPTLKIGTGTQTSTPLPLVLDNPPKSVGNQGQYILLNKNSVPDYLDPSSSTDTDTYLDVKLQKKPDYLSINASSSQDTYLDVNPNYLNVSKSNPLYHVANPKPKTEYLYPTELSKNKNKNLQLIPPRYLNTSSANSGRPLTISSTNKNINPNYSVYEAENPTKKKNKTKNIKSVNGKSNPGYFTGKGPGNVDYASASTIQVGSMQKPTNKKKNNSKTHLAFANLGYKTANGQGNKDYAELSQTPIVSVSNPIYKSNPVNHYSKLNTNRSKKGNYYSHLTPNPRIVPNTGKFNPYRKLNRNEVNVTNDKNRVLGREFNISQGYRVAEAPKHNVEYAKASTNSVDSKEQTSLTPKPEILPNSGANTNYPTGKQKPFEQGNTVPGVALRTTAIEPFIISTTNKNPTTFAEARQAIQAKIASQNIKPKPLKPLSQLPKALVASKVYLNTSTKGSISTNPDPSDDIDVIDN